MNDGRSRHSIIIPNYCNTMVGWRRPKNHELREWRPTCSPRQMIGGVGAWRLRSISAFRELIRFPFPKFHPSRSSASPRYGNLNSQ